MICSTVTQTCTHREEEARALRQEDEEEGGGETGEGAEHDVHPPALYGEGANVAVNRPVEVPDDHPGQQGGEDGAEDPEGSEDDDKRSTTFSGEELTEV